MKQALWTLLNDFLSAILFVLVYALSDSLAAAAGIAIAAGVLQFARLRLSGRRIEPMQWMSLGLVLAFGAATMLTHSPRFMMAKPSVVHFAIAAVMLRPGWMGRYLPEIVRLRMPPAAVTAAVTAAGYGWAALMAALGLANLAIAAECDLATWAWFVSVGAIGAKFAALALQYAVFRVLMGRQAVRQPA